jgi:steroid delta-isomerase
MNGIDRIANFFEHFGPTDLARLPDFYTEDAFFKDPFNEVRGIPAIERVYAHMFEALKEPRFVVTARIGQGAQWCLLWDFRFRFRSGEAEVIRGASHLRLAADGRIEWHRDYWDAAEELYEKLPVLGALMRWLKRRARG